MVADTLFAAPAPCDVENERVPLAPTEKSNNGGISRKPRNREVSSRYKSALQPPPSRRFPSPNIGRNADAAPPEPPKRALSAERKRSTGGADTITSTSTDEGTRASKEMWSQRITGSLETQAAGNENSKLDHALKPAANVTHQGLAASTGRPRRGTPERKRNPGWRQSTDQAENARPFENLVARPDLQKWPGTTNGKCISRSMDLSLERDRGRPSCIGSRASRCLAPARSFNQLMSLNGNQESVQSKPQSLQQSANSAGASKDDASRLRRLLDEADLGSCDAASDAFGSENASVQSECFDVDNASIASSDRSESERVSPPDSSGAPMNKQPGPRPNRSVRGTVVPARFWQDLDSKIRRLSDVNHLRSSMPEGELTGTRTGRRAKGTFSAPTSAVNTPANAGAASWGFSPGRAPPTAPQPPLSPSGTTKVSSPSRALPSPTRTRAGAFPMPMQQSVRPSSVACMLNFGVDSYKGKKGMSQQEEAHYLRILHNRWLQGRFSNARAEAAMNSQKATAERILYNASMQISDLRSTVAAKRIKLQQARQTEKVHSIIDSHGKHLEEWAELEQEHSFALSGAIEALEAGTLKVPVTGGAKIDVQALNYALSSAADAMTSLESSAGSLLPSAEKTSEIVSELAQVAAQEKALLQDCGDLLDRIATLEVEERSLRSYFLQLGIEKRRMALGSSCSN